MKPFTLFLIILLSVLVFLIIVLLIVNYISSKFFKFRSDGDVRYSFKSVRDYPNLKQEFVSTINRKNVKLEGSIFYYENIKHKGTIIFYHGLYSGYLNYLNLIEYFVKNGYKVVAFDFTGSMSSGGKSIKGMANSEIDADAIIKFTLDDRRLNNLPIYTVGHSWGAHTALTSLLHEDVKIKKAVAFCPFNSHVDCTYSLNAFNKVFSPFIYILNYIKFGHQSTYKVTDVINYCDNEILIYSGKHDTIVKKQYSYNKFIKRARTHNNNVKVELIDSNHFVHMSDNAAKYFEKAISWPRVTPIDFKTLDYKLLDELNEPLLKETLAFLEK